MEIPIQLQKKGIKFVLLERQGKKPFQKEWQNKLIEFDNPELLEHISTGCNYGVMGGGLNLIIIDFDNEKLQEEICKKLPETFTVKTGSGKLHKYFFSDKTESFKIFDEEMNTLADIQGEGKQVVGAGSIHPNGNRYEVIDTREINTLAYAELKAMLMPYDKKPKKEKKEYDKPRVENTDDFIDKIKHCISLQNVMESFGVDTSINPTACPFHSSKGGKCLGFNRDTAHCFHCDGSWNIFSFVKEMKKCDSKEAIEYLSNIAGLMDELEISRRKYIDEINKNKRTEKEQVKSLFLTYIKDKKWGDSCETIVDYILRHNYIYTTKCDEKSEMWIYKDGIYIPNGKCEVKEIMRDILGNWYSAFFYNQVINKIEPDTFIEIKEFFKQGNIEEIPVKNGILNVMTKELKPYSPEKIFFNKLPVEYDPQAKCPRIESFVNEVLANVDDAKVFYEMGGFSLLKEYKFEKAFMFVGNGRNGKDKTLELIKRLIGAENCCSVPLSSIIPESFIISEFFGRMVNLAGEINNTDLKDTSQFKALTGRSLVSAPRKFLNAITFQNYAKFIFACNDLPMVYDDSLGFWDRWVLLEFPYTFVTADEYTNALDKSNLKLRDENIIEKITVPQEMSGLLNKFLEGLDRLTQFKTFSSTKGSQEIKETWIRRSNSFLAFCQDFIEDNYDGKILKKEMRKRYILYCKKHKVKAKTDFVIRKTLQEYYGVSDSQDLDNGMRTWVWDGISWKI